MKKPKRIRKYETDGYIFDTFKELKKYVYFNTSIKMKKICYELDGDVITKKYIFTKQERRLICEKKYDKDIEDLKKWNHKQRKYIQAFATDNSYLPEDYLETLSNEKDSVRLRPVMNCLCTTSGSA